MAETFSTRIAIEGADDVKAKLLEIGKSGEKAFKTVTDATGKVNPALDAVSNSVGKATGAMARFGQTLPGIAGALAPFSSGLSSMIGLFGTLAGGAGILAAVGAIGFFVKSAADAVVQSERTAKSLGLTADQFSVLKRAARDAGIDVDQLSGALTRFAGKSAAEAKEQFGDLGKLVEIVGKQIAGANFSNPSGIRFAADLGKVKEAIGPVAAQIKSLLDQVATPGRPSPSLNQIEQQLLRLATQGGAAGEEVRKLLAGVGASVPGLTPLENLNQLVQKNTVSLASLGVSLLDNKGNAIGEFEALEKVIGALKAMPDGLKKTAIEAQIFGRAIGPELGEALAKLDFEKAKAALKELGIGFDENKLKAGIEFKKALNDLDDASKKTSGTLLQTFGPLLTGALGAFNDALKTDAEDVKKFGAIITAIGDNDFLKMVGASVKQFSGDVADLAQNSLEALKTKFNEVAGSDFVAGVKANITGMPGAFAAMWDDVKTDAGRSADEIVAFFRSLPSGLGTLFDQIKGGAGRAVDDVVGFFSALPARVGAAVEGVGSTVVGFFSALPGRIGAGLSALGGVLAAPFSGVGGVVSGLVDSVVNFFSALPGRIGTGLSTVAETIAAPFRGVGDAISEILDGVVSFFTGLPERIGAGLSSAAEIIAVPFRSVGDTIGGIVETVIGFFAALPGRISSAVSGLGEILAQPFRAAADLISGIVDRIAGFVRRILGLAGEAQGAASGSSGGGSDGLGFAGGGYIRGAGTGTSDSIPAWLSHGEYVEPAHVVRQPGVLAFLGLLRDTGGDLAEAIRRFGRGFASGGLAGAGFSSAGLAARLNGSARFAAGGLVGAPAAAAPSIALLPRFAAGGLVDGLVSGLSDLVGGLSAGRGLVPSFAGGGDLTLAFDMPRVEPRFAAGGLAAKPPAARAALHPVTINLGGGRSVGGLLAPTDVVGVLRREAILQGITSTSKK